MADLAGFCVAGVQPLCTNLQKLADRGHGKQDRAALLQGGQSRRIVAGDTVQRFSQGRICLRLKQNLCRFNPGFDVRSENMSHIEGKAVNFAALKSLLETGLRLAGKGRAYHALGDWEPKVGRGGRAFFQRFQ